MKKYFVLFFCRRKILEGEGVHSQGVIRKVSLLPAEGDVKAGV
jgi:hypothetical protein